MVTLVETAFLPYLVHNTHTKHALFIELSLVKPPDQALVILLMI